jgi:hypothetical protein
MSKQEMLEMRCVCRCNTRQKEELRRRVEGKHGTTIAILAFKP